MLRYFCAALLLLSYVPDSAVAAEAKDVKMASSGWSVSSTAADSDASGTGGFVSELPGKGSLGKYVRKNAGDLADWDGVSYCDFDPVTVIPSGVVLDYLTLSSVIRVSNGDRLELEMSSSPPSTLCFNFVFNNFTLEVYSDVVGGTGGFSGATGSIESRGGGRSLQNMSSFDLQSIGVLYLEEGEHDNEEDHDD